MNSENTRQVIVVALITCMVACVSCSFAVWNTTSDRDWYRNAYREIVRQRDVLKEANEEIVKKHNDLLAEKNNAVSQRNDIVNRYKKILTDLVSIAEKDKVIKELLINHGVKFEEKKK